MSACVWWGLFVLGQALFLCVGLSLSSLCRTPAHCLFASANFPMDGISSFGAFSQPSFLCVFIELSPLTLSVLLIN